MWTPEWLQILVYERRIDNKEFPATTVDLTCYYK